MISCTTSKPKPAAKLCKPNTTKILRIDKPLKDLPSGHYYVK